MGMIEVNLTDEQARRLRMAATTKGREAREAALDADRAATKAAYANRLAVTDNALKRAERERAAAREWEAIAAAVAKAISANDPANIPDGWD